MFTNDTRVIADHGAWVADLDTLPGRPVERREDGVWSLAQQLDAEAGRCRVIGQSAQWQDVLKKAAQVAATETTVLLQGDSGTGKEVVARLIHRSSPRKNGPFLAINCAALPEQLLESELFGHERGAFTGALQHKPGQVEVASGGVLFIDEVGEMSPSAQAKLLRVLQEREFQRLGATRTLKANVRVVTATNRELRKAVGGVHSRLSRLRPGQGESPRTEALPAPHPGPLVQIFVDGLGLGSPAQRRARAEQILSTMLGAVTFARAMSDAEAGAEFLSHVRSRVLRDLEEEEAKPLAK